jgi:hypothetical protein
MIIEAPFGAARDSAPSFFGCPAGPVGERFVKRELSAGAAGRTL